MRVEILTATVLSMAALLTSAQANTISGSLWHVSEAASQNAVPANVPITAPDVTFNVNSPFNFFGTSTTVGNWLTSSGASNVSENTPGVLSTLMDPTIVRFTGFVTVTSGQTFTVTHDDGLTLTIGAINLGFSPFPTAPTTTTTTYTGPSGTFPFDLVYGECCGGPAVLQLDLPFSNTPQVPSGVPEGGATVVMLGSTLLGLLGLSKRAARK